MVGQYRLTTLGCKVNQYESQQLREVLESFGLRPADNGGVPTIAVVNTCAVTAQASRKNRQAIRRLSERGRVPVVVVGCGAAADGARLKQLPGVLAVYGHEVDIGLELRVLLQSRFNLLARGNDHYETSSPGMDRLTPRAGLNEGWMMADAHRGARPVAVSRTTEDDPSVPLPIVKTSDALLGRIEAFAGHQRAFLKVQDGCDAHCTYCIIPRLRPTLRSKPIETALAEAHDLVRSGHREIIVTGIFLGAYGRDSALRKRWVNGRSPLSALVEALSRVRGLVRLRLSSLEPGDMDDSLLEVIADHGACVPHFHLPLQSGSPEILRRMNRQYSRDQFIDMVDRVRSRLDRPAISTDIIVGFPGESETDFQATLDIARYAQFVKVHAFPFSARDGTAAARWGKEFVPAHVVRERMNQLVDVERRSSFEFRKQFVGHVERVIVERNTARYDDPRNASVGDEAEGASVDASPGPNASPSHSTNQSELMTGGPDQPRIVHGRSDRYFEIHFESSWVAPGSLARVRIDRVTPTRTHGTCLHPVGAAVSLPVLATC